MLSQWEYPGGHLQSPLTLHLFSSLNPARKHVIIQFYILHPTFSEKSSWKAEANVARSKMASPFRRKDVLKAFFDLDVSDTEPSSAKASKPGLAPPGPRRYSLVPTTKEDEQESKLMVLPSEIRTQIYDPLLVSRFDREQNPSWAVGKTCQKSVILRMIQAPEYRTMEVAILQTCKQIYDEAIPILYSRNEFAISEPDEMFRLMAQIGPTNIKLIKSLDIWVPWCAEILPWVLLLGILSEDAIGLRSIKLGWGADCEFSWQLKKGAKERGFGDNLPFVRALARIQGLEKLHIEGYYAKHWPSYLMDKTGAQVQAVCGHPLELSADDDAATEIWLCDLNEKNLHSFTEYQKGTEDLIP